MLDLPESFATTTHADLLGRAPSPEFLQRLANARQSNIAMAQRRCLDRETYKGLRQYIRAPRDLIEAARNARWRDLHSLLAAAPFASPSWRATLLSHIRDLRQPETVRALVAAGCLL